MKTAVSLPDDIFKRAEALARRTKKSRSQVYSEAIAEYLARHSPNEITRKMNEVCAELGTTADDFGQRAGHRVLSNVKW